MDWDLRSGMVEQLELFQPDTFVPVNNGQVQTDLFKFPDYLDKLSVGKFICCSHVWAYTRRE